MEDVNPFAAPQASLELVPPPVDDESAILRQRDMLLVPEGVVPPSRCVCCNEPATELLTVRAFKGGSARRLPVRIIMGILFGCAVGIFSAFVLPHTHPWGFMVLWAFAMLFGYGVNFLLRHHDQVAFDFYLCPQHRRLRHAGQVMMWLLVAPMIAFPIIEELLPDFDPFPVFSLWMVAFWIVLLALYRTGTYIRPVLRRSDPYAFKGFGKRYLQSFPAMDEA